MKDEKLKLCLLHLDKTMGEILERVVTLEAVVARIGDKAWKEETIKRMTKK